MYASSAPHLGFFQNVCNIYSLHNLDESTTLRAALRRRHLSLDGGMVCHSGWMNNTSLGTLDLLHVSFIHDVELMAEILRLRTVSRQPK